MADPVTSSLATGTSSTAATTVSFAAQPAGTLLLLSVASDDYRVGSPTGWSLISDQHTFHGHAVWYKLASGSETSVAYVIGSAARSAYLLLTATNIDQTTPLDVSAGQFKQSVSTSYNTPSVTPTSGRKLSVGWLGASNSTTVMVAPTGWTNSYVAAGSAQSTSAPGEVTAAAQLVLDGGTATSTGATFAGPTYPQAVTGIGAVFNVATGATTPTVTGTVAASVALTGAAKVLAVAAGSLALGLALSGTAVPVAVATGTLPVVAALTGTASSAATATGAMPASVALTGTASQTGTYTATGSLPAALSLTGTASMIATVTGSLPLTAGLSGAGSVVGSYVTTGNLPLTVALTGTAQTIPTVTGALPLSVGLTGSANVPAVPALTGTLPTALSLSGAANIVALTTGTLPVSVALSGVGVNPSNEHDITVTAALDPRPWASALTTRTNTGLLVQRSWEARLE